MNRAHKAYRTVQTTTASSIELVLMLYRGGIKFLNAAEAALADGNIEAAHRALLRAQDIVRELRTSLDAARGGEVATELERVYVYCEERLLDANMRKDAEHIVEVRALLQELAASWENVRQTGAAAAAATAPAGGGGAIA